MNPLCAIVFACVITGSAFAAQIDEACSKSSECTVSNSYCYKKFSNCDKGSCMCKSGYQANSQNDACLQEMGLAVTCSASTHCLYGAVCSGSSVCNCDSGKEYNSKLKMCVTTGLKAIGEVCSSVSDCYGSTTMVECVGTSTKTCKCKTGYTTDSYTCRLPHVTEDCASSPGCQKQYDVGTGQETETCVNDVCKCPATADKVSAVDGGTRYTLCYTKYSSKKAASSTCSQSNECSNHRCEACPGETNKKCLKLSSSGENVGSSCLLLLIATVLAFLS